MKKIVNGKVYDTETAKLLASANNYAPRGDFYFYEEELYVKKTGEYFLYGFGGAMTRYARQIDHSNWMGGEAITPLTYTSAREWAEDMLEADEYLALFIADDESSTINTQVTGATRAKLDKLRAETGKSFGELIDDAFQDVD